jgi:hypothetical protein
VFRIPVNEREREKERERERESESESECERERGRERERMAGWLFHWMREYKNAEETGLASSKMLSHLPKRFGSPK